jgi:hypothetical protein
MVCFGHKESNKKPLQNRPNYKNVVGPAPVGVIADESTNDGSELWSHTTKLSAMFPFYQRLK